MKSKIFNVVLLLSLMIFFSIIMGIISNYGWFSIYNSEFSAPIYSLRKGLFSWYEIVAWLCLIIIHISLLLLPFFINKKYFRSLLIWEPLLFILFFSIVQPYIILLLIPFLVSWLWALGITKKRLIK